MTTFATVLPLNYFMVTTSLNVISMAQLGNKVVVRGGGGALLRPPFPSPFYSRLLDRYLKVVGNEKGGGREAGKRLQYVSDRGDRG
jgi:hypothetical protein